MHLVGFIIRIYRDARSSERPILVSVFVIKYVQFEQEILLELHL